MIWLARATAGTPVHTQLLRIAGVSRVAALHDRGLEDLRLVARVPTLFQEDVRIFAVRDPQPRTYAVAGTRVADGPEALRVFADPSFDPRSEVVVSQGSATRAPPGFRGTSRIVHWAPDRVVIECDLSHPGLVVLLDAYDPSWKASIQGRPAAILRANVAFRAVPVDTGRHTIEMVCRPASVTAGLAVSAGTVGLLGIAALRRSRPACVGSAAT
jgi:hypothetical protein